MALSEQLFERAVKVIPGGVNSPVRAFASVGMTPKFIQRAEGAYLTDADGKTYIDYVNSWGPMILGHHHPKIYEAVIKACENGLSYGAATEIEVKLAELICASIPSVEMIRMVNSGTEAVMSAVRAARGYTKRNKIVKFTGCYHGHSDALLVKAGSGALTAGVPNSAGVPKGCTEDTLTAAYNHIEEAELLFQQYPNEIAAVIVEPVAANMGVVPPKDGFLQKLRALCTKHQSVLIFDEVITGFRLSFGGAQEYFGIVPDLSVFGKIIGAGMPVGAYGGKREIMEMVAPIGEVYQAGTLSGNPIAMTAGYTQLCILKENPEIYTSLNQMGKRLFEGMKELLKKRSLPYQVQYTGSLGSLFFTEEAVFDDASAKKSDTKKYEDYFKAMLERGIYLAPAQFEAMFLSAAHTEKEISGTLACIEESLALQESCL